VLLLVLITALPSAFAGFLIGRWPVAFVAPAAWVLFVLGEKSDWWGHGVGDGWEYALLLGAVVAASSAATGILARRGLHRPAVL
jgi:hypothetical protein